MKKREDPVQSLNLISAPTRHRRSLTAQQCTATSKRTGERCRAWALVGRKTCRVHGSATRLSAAKAQRVIAGSSGFAAEMLVEVMADPKVELKTRIQIAQDLLNRAGIAGKQQLEIGMQTVREVYANIVARSVVDVRGPKPADWDESLDGAWEDFAGQRALPASADPNVVDAEIVEDDQREQQHDAQVEAVERERVRRRRRGLDPELPPSVEQRLRPQPTPAPSIEQDPRHRSSVANRDDVTAGRERFLLEREGLAPRKRRRRGLTQ